MKASDQTAQQHSPTQSADTPAPVAHHWIMTVQTSDGRQGTNDGRISAIPGTHTRESTFTALRAHMKDWIGTDNFTVVFYSLEPNDLSAPRPAVSA